MNEAENENTENTLREENEQFSPSKGQGRNRPKVLANRNTNIDKSLTEQCELHEEKIRGGSFQQGNQESSSTRWLPTRAATFSVFCDENESDDNVTASSSRDSKHQRRKEIQGEGILFRETQLPLSKLPRRPLASLSPNPKKSGSEYDKTNGISFGFKEDEGHSRSRNTSSSSDQTESSTDSKISRQKNSDDEISQSSVQTQSKWQASPQKTFGSDTSSRIYTVEEHEDRTRIDPTYAKDIYNYMRQRELEVCPRGDFLEFQEEIDSEMRYMLVDWLCDASREFNLSTDALHMAVSIVDRVLHVMQCPRLQLQLVGAAALMLASKFEEIYPPELKEFVKITANTYCSVEILRMERIVFARIDYQVLVPSSWWFASRLTRIAHSPKKIYCMVRYLLELALLDHTLLNFRPSVVGAASFFLTSIIFQSDYQQLLSAETDIGIDELCSPARRMLQLFHEIPEYEYKGVYEKYGTEKYDQVSHLTLPNNYSELGDFR